MLLLQLLALAYGLEIQDVLEPKLIEAQNMDFAAVDVVMSRRTQLAESAKHFTHEEVESLAETTSSAAMHGVGLKQDAYVTPLDPSIQRVVVQGSEAGLILTFTTNQEISEIKNAEGDTQSPASWQDKLYGDKKGGSLIKEIETAAGQKRDLNSGTVTLNEGDTIVKIDAVDKRPKSGKSLGILTTLNGVFEKEKREKTRRSWSDLTSGEHHVALQYLKKDNGEAADVGMVDTRLEIIHGTTEDLTSYMTEGTKKGCNWPYFHISTQYCAIPAARETDINVWGLGHLAAGARYLGATAAGYLQEHICCAKLGGDGAGMYLPGAQGNHAELEAQKQAAVAHAEKVKRAASDAVQKIRALVSQIGGDRQWAESDGALGEIMEEVSALGRAVDGE